MKNDALQEGWTTGGLFWWARSITVIQNHYRLNQIQFYGWVSEYYCRCRLQWKEPVLESFLLILDLVVMTGKNVQLHKGLLRL